VVHHYANDEEVSLPEDCNHGAHRSDGVHEDELMVSANKRQNIRIKSKTGCRRDKLCSKRAGSCSAAHFDAAKTSRIADEGRTRIITSVLYVVDSKETRSSESWALLYKHELGRHKYVDHEVLHHVLCTKQ
jgi:hypothetical protein